LFKAESLQRQTEANRLVTLDLLSFISEHQVYTQPGSHGFHLDNVNDFLVEIRVKITSNNTMSLLQLTT